MEHTSSGNSPGPITITALALYFRAAPAIKSPYDFFEVCVFNAGGTLPIITAILLATVWS